MYTAIFDLDGTIADTSRDLLAAGNACFVEDGHPPPLTHADHAGVAFRGGRAMLKTGAALLGLDWEEDDIRARYPKLLGHYADRIDAETELYPGLVSVLEAMAAAGWKLGVCTNKTEALAERLLHSLGVRHHFAALIGADTLANRKPHAEPLLETIARVGGDPARAVLIGDTKTDRDTGLAAQVAVALVTFGPEGMAVADLAPEGLIEEYEYKTTPPLLAAIIERYVP